MATIYVDFNARTGDDRLRLSTKGSRDSLAQAAVNVGDWVWLTDGELRVGGQILQENGDLLAAPAWETIEDIVAADDPRRSQESIHRALADVQRWSGQQEVDYRETLRRLPIVEKALPPGSANYLRARAAQAFGFPKLAVLAIEDALRERPNHPLYMFYWLGLLRETDPGRAVQVATALVADSNASAPVLAACAQVYAEDAHRKPEDESLALERTLLNFTERFDEAPHRETTPPSVSAMVFVFRGLAWSRLGDRTKALAELNRAIRVNPAKPEAYAARGIETFPSEQAIADLERAVDLGILTFWPAYYLASHYIQCAEWERAEQYCRSALTLEPPPTIAANLLEWRAIATYERTGDAEAARRDLLEAKELAPESEHLQRNLQRLEQRMSRPDQESSWALVRDAEAQVYDVAA